MYSKPPFFKILNLNESSIDYAVVRNNLFIVVFKTFHTALTILRKNDKVKQPFV